MAPLPLTATFAGDIVTLAVLVDDEDTAATVGEKIAHHVAGRRVAARPAPVRVQLDGRVLDPDEVIGRSGATHLTHVEAFFDDRDD
ncbi:toluene monooxygenase system protein B [Actinomadura pelletieri DSM 43383]|uniref:Toluene monooxygenase system protein B n=1 Tax=Actinomadura pelletieri DSM 43383 TaxID=1120940 RepID=A0A495QX53_9ACTN|nr:toluene-4-monooxygenase system B family protein [Actinomadura pelletieri]RKS78708.1 toluene monooxygenase system protein B [Actinomadura pelletieri DSM 43383]